MLNRKLEVACLYKKINKDEMKGVNEVFDYIENHEEISFYTKQDGILKIDTDCHHIGLYSDYKEICTDWLNTGVDENDDLYRNHNNLTQKEIDRAEYYDYLKEVWFVIG